MYTLIKPDDSFTGKMPAPRIYLGGQSRGRDWRMDFFQRFSRMDLTFINPRREPFIDPELEPAAHAKQVAWERQALDVADIGVFWLGEGLSNQAARVEIGYMLGAQKPVLLGAQTGFMGVEHLVCFSGLVVAPSLEGLLNRFASVLSGLQTG
jgi:Nucleoside 2-deoxyribosyltransferase like